MNKFRTKFSSKMKSTRSQPTSIANMWNSKKEIQFGFFFAKNDSHQGSLANFNLRLTNISKFFKELLKMHTRSNYLPVIIFPTPSISPTFLHFMAWMKAQNGGQFFLNQGGLIRQCQQSQLLNKKKSKSSNFPLSKPKSLVLGNNK